MTSLSRRGIRLRLLTSTLVASVAQAIAVVAPVAQAIAVVVPDAQAIAVLVIDAQVTAVMCVRVHSGIICSPYVSRYKQPSALHACTAALT